MLIYISKHYILVLPIAFNIIVSLAFLMYFSKINNYGKSRIIIYTCDRFTVVLTTLFRSLL